MEHRIVEDFENLRVLSGKVFKLGAMDDLARDFAVALDDASRIGGGGSSASIAPPYQDCVAKRSCCKKRRYKKRKPSSGCAIGKLGVAASGNRSEASESSLDEALLKGYGVMENSAPIRHSDSDDLLNSRQVPPHLKSSHLHNVPAVVESDSVTETFSPNRPQRRRRYFKRMAVDPEPEEAELIDAGIAASMIGAQHPLFFETETERGYTRTGSTQPGKRKRSTKDKSDDNSLDLELGDDLQNDDNPENMYESCSSSVSSTESNKGHNSNEEEGQEGDDEQSDWYHEVDTSSTINPPLSGTPLPSLLGDCGPAVVVRRSRQQFCPEFPGAVEKVHRDGIAPRAFRHQLIPVNARDIQSGRRRLKDWRPMYSLSCFLEERQKWNPDIQGGCRSTDENKRGDVIGGAQDLTMDIQGGVNWVPLASSGLGGGNSKRHRLMPPADQLPYSVTGVVTDTSHEPAQHETTAGRMFTRGSVANRGCYT